MKQAKTNLTYLPPISWPGGKRHLAQQIIAKLPPHRLYVEVFGGGLAVLLAKPRSPHEVVNDIDADLVVFYRCVRYHLDELLREIAYIPNSRAEFAAFLQQPGLTDIQRAARWFVRNKISFGGLGRHFGTSKKGGGAAFASRTRRLAAIKRLNERLDSVCIEHLDWRKLLDKYDIPDACFYFDPPYTGGHQYESGAWREADHMALREHIGDLRGSWVLSYDDSPLVRHLYAGCAIKYISRATGIGKNHIHMKKVYHELIITPAQTVALGRAA